MYIMPVLNVKATCDLLQSSQKVHPISPSQNLVLRIYPINGRHYTMSNTHINIDLQLSNIETHVRCHI